MVEIHQFQTHYEIRNYELGMFVNMERDLSMWDKPRFTSCPRFEYDDNLKILYVPRGYDINKATDFFNTNIYKYISSKPKIKVDFNMRLNPIGELQEENIRFLTGTGEYSGTSKDPQLVSSLPTGEGKTYCVVASACALKLKTFVIVPTDFLRGQWKKDILKYTDLEDDKICIINSTSELVDLMNDRKRSNDVCFYIATYSVLRMFMKNQGNEKIGELFDKLNIGIKVIDEAHKAYNSILKIDYFTNVFKTIYLSATFFILDEAENSTFQKCFDKVFKFRKLNDDRVPHVQYIAHMFKTDINPIELANIRGTRGFDQKAYIDYEIKKGDIFNIITDYLHKFIDNMRIDGTIFILSTKKVSCDVFCELAQSIYPELKICSYHTGTKKDIDDIFSYDIVCATPKMLGTGNHFSDLRVVINTEPSKSNIQVKGRLRSHEVGGKSYYVEIIDKAISATTRLYRQRKAQLNMVNDVEKIIVIDTTKKKRM